MGTRTRAWSSESHALPCEMNGSSINNHLAGVGEKPVPQGKGRVLSLQESPLSFTNACGIGTPHLQTEALLEHAIHALLRCPTALKEHLKSWQGCTHSPYHPSLPWLLQSHNFSHILHYIPAKPIYPIPI